MMIDAMMIDDTLIRTAKIDSMMTDATMIDGAIAAGRTAGTMIAGTTITSAMKRPAVPNSLTMDCNMTIRCYPIGFGECDRSARIEIMTMASLSADGMCRDYKKRPNRAHRPQIRDPRQQPHLLGDYPRRIC